MKLQELLHLLLVQCVRDWAVAHLHLLWRLMQIYWHEIINQILFTYRPISQGNQKFLDWISYSRQVIQENLFSQWKLKTTGKWSWGNCIPRCSRLEPSTFAGQVLAAWQPLCQIFFYHIHCFMHFDFYHFSCCQSFHFFCTTICVSVNLAVFGQNIISHLWGGFPLHVKQVYLVRLYSTAFSKSPRKTLSLLYLDEIHSWNSNGQMIDIFSCLKF